MGRRTEHAESLTDEEALVLARLSNSPQRRVGPVTERLAERGLVTIERDREGRPTWTNITPAGLKAKRAAFDRLGGFGDLVTKFWNKEPF